VAVVAAAAASSVMPRSVAVVGGGGDGPEESAPAPVVRQLSATYKRGRIVFRNWYLLIYLLCRQSVFGTSHDNIIIVAGILEIGFEYSAHIYILLLLLLLSTRETFEK